MLTAPFSTFIYFIIDLRVFSVSYISSISQNCCGGQQPSPRKDDWIKLKKKLFMKDWNIQRKATVQAVVMKMNFRQKIMLSVMKFRQDSWWKKHQGMQLKNITDLKINHNLYFAKWEFQESTEKINLILTSKGIYIFHIRVAFKCLSRWGFF